MRRRLRRDKGAADNGRRVLRPIGALDLDSAVELREQWLGLLARQPADELVLDLSAVTSLDSAASALLVVLRQHQAERGRSFTVLNVPAQIRATLTLAGLEHLLPAE